MISQNLVYVIIGLVILFSSAEIFAFIFKIYDQTFYKVFHFAGGALIYLLFLNITQNRHLSLGLVLLVGILWEVHEWILWKFFLKKGIYKPQRGDTLNDLLMDCLGALLFYVIEIVK